MLGGIGNESPSAQGGSLVGSYSNFPCLKRMFLCESGSVTTEMIDVITGARLHSMPWTMTGPFSSYMNVISESTYPTGHHNVNLAAGTWPQPGENISIWMLCGKFDGNFSFGFGDSTPNNIEVVLTQFTGFSIVASVKTGSGTTQSVPNYLAGRVTPSTMQSSDTSIIGLLVNGTTSLTLFYTDADGTYQEFTEDFLQTEAAFNPPATYSMGRDVVTSGLSGIVDLSVISVLEFSTMPPDISDVMEKTLINWRAGRKIIDPRWAGLT